MTEHYRYINQVPLRDGDEALMLNWCQVTITNAKGEVTYHNAWVMTPLIIDETGAKMVTAGRTRWKIENETHHVLKNNGYHFDHNFEHGKPPLSNWFATLMLLSFLLHPTLDWMDTAYHTVCHLLPSRQTFVEHLRALLQDIPFNSWEPVMRFMFNALDGETIPDLTKGT
ncbi:hypothetical protein THII_2614 [Thioploca ingrica]|uniref:Transposase n=1 Tax=Thioploca ingrica TaxID=40754 RepID=A0A090BVI4_9GAMM|nr:hypothetical protein THII_2614 [Thioploca ingrica]